MTIIYRETDPVSGRWTGNSGGIDLTAFQIDQNFFEAISRIATLEANESFTVSIAFITQDTPSTFTFHMTNHTLQGPFTIPQSTFTDRGTWAPFTVYSVNDTFTENGTLYLVIFAHTSQATFSAGANDGMGHDFYKPMLSIPGGVLPTGGAVGMMLYKTDGHDFDVSWKYPVPVGGTTGQYLTKINGTDFNMQWSTLPTVTFSMETLSDFSFASPHSINQVVQWNGSNWENAFLTLEQLSDVVITSVATNDVLTWNGSEWINQAPSGGGGRNPTITAIGNSGFLSLDASLGDIFTTSPTGDITLDSSSNPVAGSLVTLLITTADASGHNINFDLGTFRVRGFITLPKVSGVELSISFRGDGNFFWEVSRSCDEQLTPVGNSGSLGIDVTFGEVFTTTPTGALTISVVNGVGGPGRRCSIIVTTSGTSSFVITFGTNFKSTGTLTTGTVSGKVFTVNFISDGTNMNEISRTTAM